MRIDLQSNLRDVIPVIDQLFSTQVPFAAAKALTDTARLVAAAMPDALAQDLDRPVEFTKRGFYVTPARKDNLQAVVGVKDKQAQYLGFQIEGGERKPTRVALRLPAQVQLDQYGNIPAGLIRSLIARAQTGKRTTKAQSKRFGVSQANELFYGEPGDGRPAGIYQRLADGASRHKLVPIIVFPRRSANYKPRFDFEGIALKVVDREFGSALEAAWRFAGATAK